MDRLKTLLQERADIVSRGVEAAEKFDPEDPKAAESLEALRTSLTEKDAEISTARQAAEALEFFRGQATPAEPGNQPGDGNPPLYEGDPDGLRSYQTPGEVFAESDAYKGWMASFPDGGPIEGQAAWSGKADARQSMFPVVGMRTASERFRGERLLTPDRMRALITSADASAGLLVRPDYQGLQDSIGTRPLTIRNLVTVINTTSDTIEYISEATRVAASAPVAEATALTGTSGTKPEGGMTFQLVQDVIRTLAIWVPATKRILQDAPQLRGIIDAYLTDDLALELEDQMLAGNGTGENFLGILNHPNIQGTGTAGDGLNILDRIRRAKRLIQVNARTTATAVVMNPEDAEAADRLKATTSGNYFGAGPYGPGVTVPRLWGVTVIESEAVPPGTALVGDFRRAVLWDRQQTNISVGTVNDDFIRNIVRVLAELRAGFGILRPSAFVEVDLAASMT